MAKSKVLKIAIPIIVIIMLILVLGVFFVYRAINPPIKEAQLIVKEGSVQLDTGSGWRDVAGEISLAVNDKIKVGDGKALVILFESIIINLNPDTEISIKEISEEYSSIKQETGSTWSKFTGLLGVKGYSVETPTTVATVRGTDFGVDVNLDNTNVTVIEGQVMVQVGNESYTVDEFYMLIAEGDNVTLVELTPEQIKRLMGNVEGVLSALKGLRQTEIDNHPTIINKIKDKYGLNDADIAEGLEKVDTGEIDQDEILAQVPETFRNMPGVQKVRELNIKINEQYNFMKELEAQLAGTS